MTLKPSSAPRDVRTPPASAPIRASASHSAGGTGGAEFEAVPVRQPGRGERRMRLLDASTNARRPQCPSGTRRSPTPTPTAPNTWRRRAAFLFDDFPFKPPDVGGDGRLASDDRRRKCPSPNVASIERGASFCFKRFFACSWPILRQKLIVAACRPFAPSASRQCQVGSARREEGGAQSITGHRARSRTRRGRRRPVPFICAGDSGSPGMRHRFFHLPVTRSTCATTSTGDVAKAAASLCEKARETSEGSETSPTRRAHDRRRPPDGGPNARAAQFAEHLDFPDARFRRGDETQPKHLSPVPGELDVLLHVPRKPAIFFSRGERRRERPSAARASSLADESVEANQAMNANGVAPLPLEQSHRKRPSSRV